MQKKETARRDFIKLSAIGLGDLAMAPMAGAAQQMAVVHTAVSPGEKKLHIVCVGAHPGDPEFGCGGTMARYSDMGHSVSFLYVTRGEASDNSKSHSEMAALRTKEAEVSCGILKARALYAGQIDGDTKLDNFTVENFKKILMVESPEVVFAHWPMDGHKDHQVTGMLVLNAWLAVKKKFQLYFYEVNTGTETMAFSPTDYVDITGVRDRKKRALLSHITQNPAAVYRDFFEPLEKFRGLEAGVNAAEAFVHFNPETKSNTYGLT